MTVEEKRGIVVEDEPGDRFPVGMRVLAVDDDPTCLMVLDTLLRRCRYHVTTTSQAVKALKLLRENKNKFDLVISDVHMPDMDGFKLLELVGLEMDLPVIMLSGNSDPKVVMKGITHGACDYLLKPVRIEELKNIWQHVIRRKKFDSRDQNNSNNPEKPATSDGGQGHPAGGNMDRNGKLNRKRKDQNEDDDEECEENGHENEDPSTQKKPRVVWSVDLHRKFVAAVNQLGIDKAVPKKILDMMNVERLTRENVASHLQKYRLYLKRISCVASQQANMVAALGGRDPSYLRMGSLDDLGDFHALTGSGQLPNAALASIPPGGMLGRLNTPAGCMRGLASSGMIQLGRAQNSSTSINDLGNLPQVVLSGNQNGNLLQGFPKSLELDQLQQSKYSSRIGEFASHIDDPSIFPAASGFSDTGVAIGSSSNSFFSVPNNPLMLQGHSQHRQSRGLGNQSSVKVAPLNPEPIDSGVTVSSHFPEQGRCNDNWQSAVPLVGFPSNQLPLSDPFIHADLSPGNLTDDISSMGSHIGNSPLDFSSTSIIPASLQDSRKDMQCPTSGLVGSNFHHDNPKFSSFGGLGNNVEQAMNYAPKQKWEDHKQDYAHNSNLIISSVNSSVPTHGVVGPLTHSFGQNNAVCNRGMDITLIGQSNRSAPYLMQHNEFEKSAMDTKMNLKEEYVMEQTKSMDGLIRNSCASLEDLMNAMIKREREEVTLMDGDIGFDGYPVRTCM